MFIAVSARATSWTGSGGVWPRATPRSMSSAVTSTVWSTHARSAASTWAS
jgi:hypothetical protein